MDPKPLLIHLHGVDDEHGDDSASDAPGSLLASHPAGGKIRPSVGSEFVIPDPKKGRKGL